MLAVRTFILWMHLAAIVVWAGGMVAVTFVAGPVIRRAVGLDAVEALVRRFQRLSRELVLVILLTGIFNLILVGTVTRFDLSTAYLTIVGTKVALFVVIVGNQMWYSYKLVPGWVRAEKSPRTPMWSAIVNVVLAALVLFLGLSLRNV